MIRRRPSHIRSLVALTGLLAVTLPAAAHAASIGIDFGGNVSGVGAQTQMAPSEVAGVLPQSHWNSYTALSQTTPQPLVDDAGTATGATLTWSGSPNLYIQPGTPDTAGNLRMMRGYLDTTASSTTTITVTDVPYAIYDVIVYSDNQAPSHVGKYTIGTTSQYVTQQGSAFNGTFVEDTDGLGSGQGNYTVFHNITGNTFSLLAHAQAYRAPVNGIQIVAVPSPAALPGGLALLGLAAAGRRRRR